MVPSKLQPLHLLLASCRLEMNNGRQHRQLSAPPAPSSPSLSPPGTPRIAATQKISPPASLIIAMCQEPVQGQPLGLPSSILSNLQRPRWGGAGGCGGTWRGRAPLASPVLGDLVTAACAHSRVPAGLPPPGSSSLAAWAPMSPHVPRCPRCSRPEQRVSSPPPPPPRRAAWPAAPCALAVAAGLSEALGLSPSCRAAVTRLSSASRNCSRFCRRILHFT